uniref:Endonuclease/exonuclease/phosphatase domain-containing protein n=1 Tax=Mycena chlorophos TaxID=658473 RepID=A0ABQ0L939_MYCCL|nr:predicted protein [Mycena chlorophos]
MNVNAPSFSRVCINNSYHLAVLSWNLNGKFLAYLSCPDFDVQMRGLDVFCVQETHLRPEQESMVPEIAGYEWFFASRRVPGKGRVHGGVATLVRRSLKAKFCGEWSATDMLVLQIADLLLVNVYVLPVNSICDYRLWQRAHPWYLYLHLLDDLAERGHRVSSHGDLNARPGASVPTFDTHPPRVVDDLKLTIRGRQLLAVCSRNKYIIVNGCSNVDGDHRGFTYYRHQDASTPLYRSTIDFTIVSSNIFDRVEPVTLPGLMNESS